MTFLATLSLVSLMTTILPDGVKPKAEKLDVVVVSQGHFENNNSGLTGKESFLLLPDYDTFEKYFGTVPPFGVGNQAGKRKAVTITKESFDKKLVAAVVMRGPLVEYSDVEATGTGDTVTITYKAAIAPPSTARFSSPLFVVLPNDKAKKIIFIESGKEVGTAK